MWAKRFGRSKGSWRSVTNTDDPRPESAAEGETAEVTRNDVAGRPISRRWTGIAVSHHCGRDGAKASRTTATDASDDRRRTYCQSMPGDLHYAREKFATARYQLAIGDGTLRERFLRAYLDQAHHALPLRSGLGPPISQELADDLNGFGDDMSQRSAVAGEGTVAATVAALTDDELHDAVARFLALASDLDREYYRS